MHIARGYSYFSRDPWNHYKHTHTHTVLSILGTRKSIIYTLRLHVHLRLRTESYFNWEGLNIARNYYARDPVDQSEWKKNDI